MALLRSAVMVFGVLCSSAAHAIIIDFEELSTSAAPFTPISSFTENGFTFDLSFSGSNLGPAIFDTRCAPFSLVQSDTSAANALCNGDSDLVSPTQPADEADDVDFEGVAGQVLILQEDDAEIPDDDGDGGTITFTSGAGNLPFFLNSFWAIDDEEIVLTAGGLMATVDNPSNNDVGQGILSSPVRINPGDSFSVSFESSGAIDGISITPVPIPASALFLLGGLGGLVVLRQRNNASRKEAPLAA